MTVRLKEIADLVTTCIASDSRPFVALEHLESATGRLVADADLPERTAPETGAASVEPGDVLFGKLRPYLAKTWLADRPVFASTELLCLRPRAGANSRWLAYLVASTPVLEWAVATSDGTKMPRTSWEKLAEYRVDVPPMSTQRAIADYLDRETARIDALIEKKRQLKDLLQERRQTLITQAISGSGDPRAAERDDRVSWPSVALRRVAHFAYGESLPDASRVDGDVPVYGSNGSVGLHDRANTRAPVIVIGRKGSFGKLQFSAEPVFAIDTTFYVDETKTEADIRWLFYAFQTLCLDDLSEDVGVPGLSREKAYEQRLSLPSLHEQQAIADYLDRETARIDALIEKIDKQLGLLTEHRQALITAAVTGDLEI